MLRAESAESSTRRPAGLAQMVLGGVVIAALLLAGWGAAHAVSNLRSALGLAPVAAALPATLAVTVGAGDGFSPVAGVASPGSTVTFRNTLNRAVRLRSANDSPNT